MSVKSILWIDDDYTILTGLESFLVEIPGTTLTTVGSIGEARKILQGSAVDVLLFDMVLMRDEWHVALGRRTGMNLVQQAIGKGVKEFVAYTVLRKSEVTASWEKLLSVITAGTGNENEPVKLDDLRLEYFSKNTSSVKEVRDHVLECVKRTTGQ